MELREYFEIIWRRKWVILSTMLITLLVAIAGTVATARVYEASATLRIATSAAGTISNLRYDLNYADRLMSTYENIATSAPVIYKLDQAFGNVDKDAISVEIFANTELMAITAQDTEPERARNIANMAADLLVLEMQNSGSLQQNDSEQLQARIAILEQELEAERRSYETISEEKGADSEEALVIQQSLDAKRNIYGSLLTSYEQTRLLQTSQRSGASIITPAATPDQPAKPNPILNAALGLVLGLLGGLGLAFLFENLDSRLRTREQIESALKLPTLGRIPASVQVTGSRYGAPLAEAYRRLGANILSHIRETDQKVFVITSALSGEGKTTIAANLASSLSYSGLAVAVVDCDLHNPTLHTLFGVANERGLTSVLSKQSSLTDALQNPPMMRVSILTSGPISANPFDAKSSSGSVMRRVHPGQVELLSTAQMVAAIGALRERFDVVLLDTAPSLEVTDAAVLSPLVDGVILVADLSQAEQQILQEVHQQLNDVNANVLGTVLTRDNSSLAYAKNLRRTNKRQSVNNHGGYTGIGNQASGSYISLPSELTQETRGIQSPHQTQETRVIRTPYQTQDTTAIRNGSYGPRHQ